jgi:hypothetical protein
VFAEAKSEAAWQQIEAQLGVHLVRVYRLGAAPTVRLDATTGSVNHDPDTHPLFQVGKAKNGQYETQYKLMLASLDPLGLTLAVDVVSWRSGRRSTLSTLLPACQAGALRKRCPGGG